MYAELANLGDRHHMSVIGAVVYPIFYHPGSTSKQLMTACIMHTLFILACSIAPTISMNYHKKYVQLPFVHTELSLYYCLLLSNENQIVLCFEI